MLSVREMIKSMEGKRVDEQAAIIDALKHVNSLLLDIKLHDMPKGDFLYLTICGKSDLDMAKASVYSFALNSTIHPQQYVVVSDGTWGIYEGERFFQNCALPMRFISWEECVASIVNMYPEMKSWCEKQVWGKKLAAIISFSVNNAVLFSDSDVLWFGTPFNDDELKHLKLKLTIDNDCFYDKDCLKSLNLESLYDMPFPINCGVLFIRDFNQIITPESRKCMKYESKTPGKFSEQTFFAILNKTYNTVWLRSQIKVDISDMISDFANTSEITNGMIARHYVWRLKWIFWKDYITMRLNLIS